MVDAAISAASPGTSHDHEARVGRVRADRATTGLLPFLLTAERRQVEHGIGAAHCLRTTAECRVGVEHRVAVAQEAAHTRLLRGAVGRPAEARPRAAVQRRGS